MKVCTRCPEKGEQPLTNFGRDTRSGDGHRSECRACRSAEAAIYYASLLPEEKLERSRRTNALKNIRRQWILDYLVTHPCVDCGEDDPVVLDFDHVRDIKSVEISTLVHSQASLERLENEVKKCDVRCANCHRRKTATERGSYRLRLVA